MIPLRDVIPSGSTPVVTMALLAVNVVVFFYQWSLGERAGTAFVFEWGVIPADFTILTMFTSMFLHGGFLHAGGNMLYLWIFGDNVEDRFGRGRFLFFYLLCGAAAANAQTLFNPDSRIPMVGASGAVAGVMGAYFVMYPHSRIVTLIPFLFLQIIAVPAVFFLGIWFLMQLLSGVGSIAQVEAGTGGVAFWAHVAGFAVGVMGGLLLRRPERERVEYWHDR